MPSNQIVRKVQVAIAATPADDPAKVADLAIRLAGLASLDLKIVGCAIPSLFDLPPSAPMIGVPIPGFVMEQYRTCGRAEIQKVCNEIIVILDKGLPENAKPEIGYIDGPLNQIVPTLISTFEVLIIPHPLKLPAKFRIRRPALDSLLIKYKKVPILFCTDTSICRRIVIAQVDNCTNFQDEQILSRLADSFGAPVYRWPIYKSYRKKLQQRETKGQKSYGIPDNYEVDDDSVLAEQLGTWLVIPGHVVLCLFRFSWMRSILRNWQGNCLILP
jgi:hypothetical protein